MSISRESLVKYLKDELALQTEAINDDTTLFTDGLLDSFSIGDLLLFLEEQGEFIVEPEEVVVENLDSINRILAYVQRKCGMTSA